MPDTGAPWNIPYVESTDLVSDWPADSLALANAIDAGLDAAGNAGIGSNVVQTATTTGTTTTSSSYQNTSLTATITPTSASSKVLIIFSIGETESQDNGGGAFVSLFRGTVSGTSLGAVFGQNYQGVGGGRLESNVGAVYLDSPATTSPTQYMVGLKSQNGRSNKVGAQQNMVLIEVSA